MGDTLDGPHSFISLDHSRRISPCEDALSDLCKINNGLCKTPSRPRPWSVVGNESKQNTNDQGIGSDSLHTTPDELDNGNEKNNVDSFDNVAPKSMCLIF